MPEAISGEAAHALPLIVFLALLSWISAWIAARFGYYQMPAWDSPRPGRVALWDVFGVFITFLTAEIVAVPALFYLWKNMHGEHFDAAQLDAQTQGAINLAAIVCAGVFVGAFCFLSRPETLKGVLGDHFWLSWKRSLKDVSLGGVSWLVAYPLVGLISQLVGLLMFIVFHGPQVQQVAVKHLRNLVEFPWLFWTSVALIVTVVPVLEEILFRGFLQGWLVRVMGVGTGIFFSAATFALFHFSTSQGVGNVELLASLFVLACYLGFLRERQRSLWASIGLHATFNIVSILLIIAD